MTLRLNGSTSGYVEIDAPATAGNNTLVLPSSGDLAVTTQLGTRNRIINGDMRIDQRNAGASVTPANGDYALDRFQTILSQASKYSVQQNAGSVTPPVGFTNYLGVTSLSAYTVGASERFQIRQYIEGFNTADLGWGTASAAAVTLSFWVRSSLTGTFGGSILNSAQDRSYPYAYTISSANTWEQKIITISGDTSGTWIGATNGIGLQVAFTLGAGSSLSGTAGAWVGSNIVSVTGAVSVVGTNGATFYITGVQLEAGTVATPFERRSYGQELSLCQRYLGGIDTRGLGANYHHYGVFTSDGTTSGMGNISFAVTMRARPTKIYSSAANKFWGYGATGFTTIAYDQGGVNSGVVSLSGGSGGQASGTAGRFLANNNTDAYILFEAEL